MNNEQILDATFKKNNCEGILGKDGRVYKAIIEAMNIATYNVKGYEVGELGIVMAAPLQCKTSQPAIHIVDEDGNLVWDGYLISILHISRNIESFVDKVNYGITNERARVSFMNDTRLREWYKANYDKHNEEVEDENPKRQYFKDAHTLKSYALDFVAEKGKATSTEIKRFMYELANLGQTYDPIENRGWYCSYFSAAGYGRFRREAVLTTPSKNDDRVLNRNNDGTYSVVTYKN